MEAASTVYTHLLTHAYKRTKAEKDCPI